jgi:group I intron endonuclease
MIGIYGIHNLSNNKWYVGQSIDIERRWKHHRFALKNGYHYNKHLLRAWNYYGDSSFEFIVLELCSTDELNDKERKWIADLDSHNNGYNQCEGGESPAGRIVPDEVKLAESLARQGTRNPFYGKHHTEQYKKMISERQRGEKNHMYGKYGKLNSHSRKVRCIETQKIYDAIKDAERDTGINCNNICSCCAGRLKTAGKFHWEYV